VNPGGEPGRDEGGLPPVDVDIPDDARELDREVLAYQREQRALRRRARWARLLGPLHQHGALMPLIASCVALSMLAGTLLSVFSISPAAAPVLSHSAGPGAGSGADPGASSDATSGASSQASPASPARPAPEASHLPLGTVYVDGKATAVRGLVRAVLVLVPRGCRCQQAVQQVTTQAARAGVRRVYFVGTADRMTDVTQLTRTAGLGTAVAVKDATNVLGAAYHPAGLTIVLVQADATTSVRRHLVAGQFQLEDQLRQLGTAGQGASPQPGSAASVVPTPT
jgi:hypothetical protein